MGSSPYEFFPNLRSVVAPRSPLTGHDESMKSSKSISAPGAPADATSDDDDFFGAVQAVLNAQTTGATVGMFKRIDTAMFLGFTAKALAETVNAEQIEAYTNVEEIAIGYGDTLKAIAAGLTRHAEAVRHRPDLFRQPHLSLSKNVTEDAQFPQDLIEGRRPATDEEAQVLADQTAAHLLRFAAAVTEAAAVFRTVPFARFSDPGYPPSQLAIERRIRCFQEHQFLGRLLIEDRHLTTTSYFLGDSAFLDRTCGTIYDALTAADRHGEPTDPESLAEMILARGWATRPGVGRVGTREGLMRCMAAMRDDACAPEDVLKIAHMIAANPPPKPATHPAHLVGPANLFGAGVAEEDKVPSALPTASVPAQVVADAPTALYRWYDQDDLLLYIGITGNLGVRQDGHAKRSSWSEFATRSTVERFPTRAEAENAEAAAIRAEQPLFNHTHNNTAEARRRLVAYLVEKDRLDLLTPAVSRG